MSAPALQFTAEHLSEDRSNHGLWTPPQPSQCPSCTSPASTPRKYNFRSEAPAPRSERSSGDFSDKLSTSSKSSCTESSVSSANSRIRNSGRRIAQIIRLKPECVDKYKEVHAKAWPEVLRQIRNSGIRDYHIFHDPQTNLLFATFNYIGYGFADDMERMRENKTVQEWWKMTDGMQESLVGGATGSAEGAWWRDVERVFYAA